MPSTSTVWLLSPGSSTSSGQLTGGTPVVLLLVVPLAVVPLPVVPLSVALLSVALLSVALLVVVTALLLFVLPLPPPEGASRVTGYRSAREQPRLGTPHAARQNTARRRLIARLRG